MTGGIVKAALISTLLIFLILLFQFHSVTETLVVMSSSRCRCLAAPSGC